MTPAWGVGGVILLLTGAVYTLIGIKNRLLQTFFSTGYLASLGTTVLIIYVMSPPISNAIQGAYLVAIVCTGLILGGIATVFKEITEGFGCLLGGFSLAMWLLCVREGGLIQSLTGIIVLIACLTVGAYVLYFSHYTRHYALMACIAFGGATVTVLGIDAFSRAGLLAFWAYIWNLNDDLFPLGTVTYPLTKGIRVELAAVILLFLAGVISQLKLWRLVQERRVKRDAARADEELKQQRDEENIGRQIEETTAHERQQWEAIYGDGTVVAPPPATAPGAAGDKAGSSDSGVGDIDQDSEKLTAHSPRTSILRDSQQGGTASAGINSSSEVTEKSQPIEMTEMQQASSPQGRAAAGAVMALEGQEGAAVVVRVAQDEYPELPPVPKSSNPTETGIHEPAESRQASRRVSAQNLNEKRQVSASPKIVPLPFAVPDGNGDGDELYERDSHNDDRSSVATFADEDEIMPTVTARGKRRSLANRLSQSPAELFRSLSQRSKRDSGVLESTVLTAQGQSREGLVDVETMNDDNSSLAVTMDGLSDDDDDDRLSRNIEVKPEFSGVTQPDAETPDELAIVQDPTPPASMIQAVSAADATEKKGGAKSTVSVESTPVSLTKEHLPRSLSRVALSYRTNEWAKHLSLAETPNIEALQLTEPRQPLVAAALASSVHSAEVESIVGEEGAKAPEAIDNGGENDSDEEAPAPVNVVALQQTAETGAPAPAAPRSAAVAAVVAAAPAVPAISSSPTVPQAGTRNSYMSTMTSSAGSPSPGMSSLANSRIRSSSASQLATIRGLGLHQEPIAEENDSAADSSNDTVVPWHTIMAAELNSRAASYGAASGPQTLLGQREMLLRSKSQSGLYIGGPVFASASRASLASLASLPGAANSSRASLMPAIPSSSGPSSDYGTPITPSTVDLDDLPLSQRREIMRSSSLASLSMPLLPSSAMATAYAGSIVGVGNNSVSNVPASNGAGNVAFDSHQPRRDTAHLPTAAVREAQLASFRNSVASELRMSASGAGRNGSSATLRNSTSRDSMTLPFFNNANGSGNRMSSASYASTSAPYLLYTKDAQQSIDRQRSVLMGQKEAEQQRREMEQLEKEHKERAFEERMRRGDMLEAHRDAMRRLQASAQE